MGYFGDVIISGIVVGITVAVLLFLVPWGWKRWQQWRQCSNHKMSVGMSLAWQSAKPSSEWLRQNNASVLSKSNLNIPHPNYEAWVVLCNACSAHLQVGSTNGVVPRPPADSNMISPLVRPGKIVLDAKGKNAEEHAWSICDWELIEISKMSTWHGPLEWTKEVSKVKSDGS